MQILPAAPFYFDRLVIFLSTVNARPEQHIAFLGVEREEIAFSLAAFEPPVEQAFRLALDENGQVLAAFGAEYDEALGRTWLFGPFSAGPNLEAVTDALYLDLLGSLPAGIKLQELYCDLRNQECQGFAVRHGFDLYKDSAILSLPRQDWAGLAEAETAQILPFSEAHFPAFAALHGLCFPNTYYNADQMHGLLDDIHHLLLAVRGDEVVGYIFFKREAEIAEGYIDFLGVAPAWRGQGIGRQLLQAALRTIFALPEIRRACLTVNADNIPARRMYDSAGFTCERVARAFRKKIGSPAIML